MADESNPPYVAVQVSSTGSYYFAACWIWDKTTESYQIKATSSPHRRLTKAGAERMGREYAKQHGMEFRES